uniref:Glutathione s-transferase 5 n=1 Tax=Macrocystis pyrifera TaxID=35122 RepID=A0A9E7VG37_MACPY|nr:glutathione s-transferase 5 [Macrocystis pyrifera]
MSPKLILSYFDMPALGEPLRLALAMTGLPWEDQRVSKEEFMAMKPSLPYNQLPTLEVDGTLIPQSLAQMRYIGKIGGLYSEDPIEAAFADAAMEAVIDMHFHLRPTVHEQDPTKKMEMRKAMTDTFLPTWLGNLERALKTAGGSYFAGGKLSIGDIYVVCRLNWLQKGVLDGIPATIVDEYPLLCALIKSVMSEPRIVKYVESRA